MEVLTFGKKSQVPDKLVGPVRVLLTCGSEDEHKLALEAVAEINDAFGYGKLALSEEEQARVEDGAITVYIGSKSKGRQLVEDFGVSSPRAFRDGVYYYWWDQYRSHHIRSGIIALDKNAAPDAMAADLRRLILASIGYPGIQVATQKKAVASPSAVLSEKFLSEADSALVRFCDKHISPGAEAWEIRKTFDREWPDFSAAFWNPSKKTVSPN